MNLQSSVSSMMTRKPIVVEVDARLVEVKWIFDENNIHHIPVVSKGKLKGMISKIDLQFFLKGLAGNYYQEVMNQTRLKNYRAAEIMTQGLVFVSPEDTIGLVVDLFKENRFHALPVQENDELVGIITTHDIIKTLAGERTVQIV